jgi:hypothetical protein
MNTSPSVAGSGTAPASAKPHAVVTSVTPQSVQAKPMK